MKVVHVCQRDDVSTGGAVRVAVELVRHLVGIGVDAYLAFLYGPPGYFQSVIPGRCIYVGARNSTDPKAFYRYVMALGSLRPDILHHHDDCLWPQLADSLIPSHARVIHAHGPGMEPPASFKIRLLYLLQRIAANKVLCITEKARQGQVRNVGFEAHRLEVVLNGIDYHHFRPPAFEERIRAREALGLPFEAQITGFVGRLHNQVKGCDDFLKVIAGLPAAHWALIAGSGPDESELRSLAENLGISARVRFCGALNDARLAFWSMDAFCFTSRLEAFGLTIGEAMACQVPVFGFHCDGAADVLLRDDLATVVNNRDIVEMSYTLAEGLLNRNKILIKSANARDFIEREFSWDSRAERLLVVYRSLRDTQTGLA